MKKIYSFILILLVYFTGTTVKSQTIFLQEGFENGGSIPTGWTQVKKTGNATWTFMNGGEIPPGSSEGLPPTAHTGSYNAHFFKSSYSVHETFLISPKFSFEFALKPELRFWYSQYQDQLPDLPPDNNKFKLYYRTPEEGNVWTLLKEYNDPTEGWVFDSIPINDAITQKKYKEVQLGFLGISSTVGFGSCIDDIKLVETDTVTKYIEKIYASQPNLDIIPSGSANNPILKLRFPVQGNDGTLILDSLTVTALEMAGQVVAANGVKLFHTTSEYFTSTNQIGTSKSFVNGKAIFGNLNYNLPYGNSYIWVTYDIPVDNAHVFKNIKVDAKIEANAIKVNEAHFPLSELSPTGYRKINESVFYDDFETNKGWALTGEFERDAAKGLGGFYQYPDPNYAVSGTKILGTDITGLGTKLGDYEPGLTLDQYKATISNFNCSYYKELNIQFYRWLNVNFSDTSGIDYSLDNGVTWKRAWYSDALIAEHEWKFQQLSLSSVLDRKPSVSFRFTLGPTGISQFLSGWNIDNFAITGSYVNNDIGVSALIKPTNGCGHVAPEELEITVKNYGFDATTNKIPVGYSLNNGTSWTYDTLRTSIPKNGTANFTFTNLIDFTSFGSHSLLISTFLPGDEDTRNDRIDTSIIVNPTYIIPYTQNFETNDGYWTKGGTNETWNYGTPTGPKINKAYSGTKCWGTNLSGNYTNNDSAWLESPCFDFTGIDKPIIDFMIWANAEPNKDGLALYYTINEGVSWELVPTTGSYLWNWYNNPNIEALNHAGWDSVTNKWFHARQILPSAIANADLVKFRFLFKSNDTITAEGFAIDNIRLYNAPTDAGISAIVTPKNSCSLSKTQEITVSIKNYGIRPITSKDTLFATAIINTTNTIKDTFISVTPIGINQTANFTFKQKINMFSKKWYHMNTYTQAKGDTSYYVTGVSNNAKVDSAYVKGEPYYSLGPDIGTFNADTVVLDGKVHSVGGANFVHYYWKYLGRDDSTTTIADNRYFGVPSFPTGKDSINFSITISNDSSCTAKDTIGIIKSTTDIGISAIAGLANKCIDNQNQLLSVDVKNFAVDDLPATTEIKVGYTLGEEENEDPYIESFVLASDLTSGSTVNHLFSVQPVYLNEGDYTFSVFTVVNADLDYSNDTLNTSIEMYPLPTVDIGPDSILTLRADTLIFDAGPDPFSYLWQDASTNQTFPVTSKLTQKYSVTVADDHSCGTASDSVLIVSDNWVLDSLINPISKCAPSSIERIKVLLINKSPNTYASGFKIPTQIIFDGSVINTNIVLPLTLNPYDSIDYTFPNVFNMSVIKEYAINVKINPQHDMSRLDNEWVENINIWGIKQVELGADSIITQRADTILLDAGNNFETYLWQNSSTESTYQIPDQTSSRYWVLATDFNGCPSSTDTVRIIAMDLAIEELVSPEPKCDLNSINSISFTLRNTGPDPIQLGEIIDINYFINNGSPKVLTYSIPFDLLPDQTKQVTVPEDFDFEVGSNSNFTVYIDWKKDYYNENDTLKSVIYQLDHPTVDLGDDIYTTKADTVVLKAPKGYTTYYWQNSSRKDSLVVTKKYTSDYWVQVRNAYGCETSDTMTIFTYDISIPNVLGVENACGTAINKIVQLGITVNGADTLRSGQEIEVSYQCNGISAHETFVLTEKLYASKILYYTFTQPLIINSTGNYNFTAQVAMDDEVLTSNNSFSKVIHIGTQMVNLGSNIITYDPSVTLDAGSNFSNYTWNNNSHAQTLLVTNSGDYSVTTTDTYGCSDADTINVFFYRPQYDIVDINNLADSCSRNSVTKFSFTLKNNGNDIIPADSTIAINYKVNGGTNINNSYKFTSNFDPLEEVEIPLITPTDLRIPGTYNILVSVTIGINTSMMDTTIQTFGLPVINLPADTATYGNTLLLNAGAGFVSYLWSNNAITQTILVEADGIYSVTVTNSNGCSSSASVKVVFLKPSYDIIEVSGLNDSCIHATDELISFVLTNSGNDVIYADSIIPIYYQINNGVPVPENYQFTEDLNPEEEVVITFETTADLSSIDTYLIAVTANFGNVASNNDTTINTWGSPSVDLGADIESTNNTEILDAGSGFSSYLWSTDETTQTITVSTSGDYWVQVTNNNSCENSDTVNVAFDAISLQVIEFTKPLIGCGQLLDEEVTIVIKNSGQRTVADGTNLVISYKLGDATRVNETLGLTSDFNQGATLTYNFATTLSISESGTYPIVFYINLESVDIETANYSISVYPEPVFFEGNDTIKVTAYPYILDPKVNAEVYQWSTGANTETISVTTDGEYKLTITQSNTCDFSDSVIVTKITGISEGWRQNISVYPNPTEKKIWISITESAQQFSLRITDLQGRSIYEKISAQPVTEVDISAWPQGVYLLTVFNRNEQEIYQIVKK